MTPKLVEVLIFSYLSILIQSAINTLCYMTLDQCEM